MNNLIWTSISNNIPTQTICSWITSLRNEGQYKGEVLILNYSDNIIRLSNLIKVFNIKIIDCNISKDDQMLIVNHRYIDIVPVLEDYKGYNIAHFDVDIWFQDDINPLFYDIKNTNGCIFSTEVYSEEDESEFGNYLDNDLMLKKLYTKRKYGGYINGGLIAGNIKNILKKLNTFKSLIQDETMINDFYGSDQNYFRYSFDIKNDKIIICYNFMINEENINDIIEKNGKLYYKEIKLIGIHLSNKKKQRKLLNYNNLYYHNRS